MPNPLISTNEFGGDFEENGKGIALEIPRMHSSQQNGLNPPREVFTTAYIRGTLPIRTAEEKSLIKHTNMDLRSLCCAREETEQNERIS